MFWGWMSDTAPVRQRIRRGILAVAGLALLLVGGLRISGAEPALVRILAIASVLLVAVLFITYRAMAMGLDAAHAAKQSALPKMPSDKDAP